MIDKQVEEVLNDDWLIRGEKIEKIQTILVENGKKLLEIDEYIKKLEEEERI